MPPTYKPLPTGNLLRQPEGLDIPQIPGNRFYDQYLRDVAADPSVLLAPDLPPIVYGSEKPLVGRVRTTDGTALEIYRLPLALTTGYDLSSTIIGVDAGNGAVRKVVSTMTIKRLLAGPVQVGTTTVIANHTDAAASTWAVSTSIVGNDLLVLVQGAAGRTVDWSLSGHMTSFTPGGQP